MNKQVLENLLSEKCFTGYTYEESVLNALGKNCDRLTLVFDDKKLVIESFPIGNNTLSCLLLKERNG